MVFDEFADSEEVHTELPGTPKLHSGGGYVTFSSHNQFIYCDLNMNSFVPARATHIDWKSYHLHNQGTLLHT